MTPQDMDESRLVDRVRNWGRTRGDAPAVQCLNAAGRMNRRTTYRELADRLEAVANEVVQRTGAGRVVLLAAPNSADWIASYLGIVAAGGTVFPISTELTLEELRAAARSSNAAGMIGNSDVLSRVQGDWPVAWNVESMQPMEGSTLAQLPPVSSGGAAMLLQSSGTTGLPKIVRRESASLDAVAENMVDAVGLTPRDIVLATLPLCHSYGVEHGLLAPMWAGCCVRFTHAFDPPVVLRQLEDEGVSIFPAVPFMYEILGAMGSGNARFKSLRRAYSAGGALPTSVREAFEKRHRVTITQLYGASEIGSVTFARSEDEGFDPKSVGRAMRGVNVRILDESNQPVPVGGEGQVAVAAPSMMSGYLNADESPFRDGHFLTGDLGHIDAHGALVVSGRMKLLIDVGGLKVNPLEVEKVLMEHPGVAECVVVPMAITPTVSRLRAVLVARAGADPPTSRELREYAKARLSSYKVPRTFEWRDALPHSNTGKILRHLIQSS